MPVSRKSDDPLQRVIPRNPKYENVGPTIDTGASLSKYLKKLEEFRENFRMRDDEIFRRMKLSTFVQLIVQVSEIRDQLQRQKQNDLPPKISEQNQGRRKKNLDPDFYVANQNADIYSDERTNNLLPVDNSSQIYNPPPTARSTLESLVSGVGEFDTYLRSNQTTSQETSRNTQTNSEFEYPYLLLDLRDRDEYDACHIITARSYPIAMLSRSVNYETAEMLAYRNKPGHIILVYDEDERIAPRAASTLVQRGYCNLYMLSGGLKLAWKLFPEGLITGDVPNSIRLALRSRGKDRSAKSRPITRQNSALSCLSREFSASSIRSGLSTSSPALYCPIGSRNSSNGIEEFLAEDIMHLTLALEKGLDDGKSVRSGYSRSTISSVRHSASGDRKPFR